MTPLPVYTFLVNNIDYRVIYSQPLPSSIENVVGNLNDQAVYIPYINKPLKNGDVFTLYGKRATIVYNMFIGKSPKVLELVANTDHIPTIITKNSEFDESSLPIKFALESAYSTTVLNCSSVNLDFNLNSLDKDGNPVSINLVRNGTQDPDSPSSSFSISINKGESLKLLLTAGSKFYFVYSNLH